MQASGARETKYHRRVGPVLVFSVLSVFSVPLCWV